ncbi:MAG: hypothetical protein ACRCU6_04305 [Fusobacteriaceae bacterium]
MKEQVFQIYRSRKPYSSKPDEKESKNMNYNRETIIREAKEGKREPFKVSLNQIGNYLREGYSINASVMQTTRLLILDIDNSIKENEFKEICKRWGIVPNIYYRTFSYVKDTNERFRAIYKLDKAYDLEQYKAIYQMFLYIFGEMDTSSSNFKQLCHGTDKEVWVMHGKELNPRDLAKRTGYLEHMKKQKEEKEKAKQSRARAYTVEGKGKFSDIEDILNHFGITRGQFHFKDAYQIYKALRDFNLEDRLQLVTEDKREEYFKRFEDGYNKGSKIGSIEEGEKDLAKRLWHELKKIHGE